MVSLYQEILDLKIWRGHGLIWLAFRHGNLRYGKSLDRLVLHKLGSQIENYTSRQEGILRHSILARTDWCITMHKCHLSC